MLKWLKDRELGNAVKRKTIYESISMGPKFAYRGIIDHKSHEGRGNMAIGNLKWTSDGYYLVSLDDKLFASDNHRITIWENPNTNTKQKVKSTIDWNRKATEYKNWSDECFWSMECHHSDVILGGGGSEVGYICFVSMLTGQPKEIIRNVFQNLQ